VVAAGTPEDIAADPRSATGEYLRRTLIAPVQLRRASVDGAPRRVRVAGRGGRRAPVSV
jgi:excinuclease UvrABC ATPase subunit